MDLIDFDDMSSFYWERPLGYWSPYSKAQRYTNLKKERMKIMSTSRTTVYVPGKIYWAKIVGDRALHPNYDGDSRQWAYELVPDDVSFLKEHRLLDRLKDKEDPKNPDKGEFLVLKKPEFTKDGEKNEPIRIYDSDNTPWDDRLIGNGTRVVAKLQIVDWGKGKKSSIYTQAIRVEELVPYEGGDFTAFDNAEDNTPKKKTSAANTSKAPAKKSVKEQLADDLDDDIPF